MTRVLTPAELAADCDCRSGSRRGERMSNALAIAEFLAAAWRLSGDDDQIPTSHGILDAALFAMSEDLAEVPGGPLTFALDSGGRVWREREEVLSAAQEAGLTSEPNPSYRTTQVQISGWAAKRVLYGLEVDPGRTVEFGRRLRAEVERARQVLSEERRGLDIFA